MEQDSRGECKQRNRVISEKLEEKEADKNIKDIQKRSKKKREKRKGM